MNKFVVNIQLEVLWQFKDLPYLKVTKDKQIVNAKTGKLLKYHPRGFYINDRYYKRKELNPLLEKINQEYCPF